MIKLIIVYQQYRCYMGSWFSPNSNFVSAEFEVNWNLKNRGTNVYSCHIPSTLPLWQTIKRKFGNKKNSPTKHPSWTLTQYNTIHSKRIIVFFQHSKYLRLVLMSLGKSCVEYSTLPCNILVYFRKNSVRFV